MGALEEVEMTRIDRALRAPVPVSDVVDYFLRRDDELGDDADVSPMKLQKLLYLAQANYLGATGGRLFDDDVLAYEHGPVVYAPYDTFRGLRTAIVRAGVETRALSSLPADVEVFLGRVWERWSGMSASALRDLTHRQRPWHVSYVRDARHTVIPDPLMAEYFGAQAPLEERVFPPAPEPEPSSDEHDRSSTGMFARPAPGGIRLPRRSRTDRSARAAALRGDQQG